MLSIPYCFVDSKNERGSNQALEHSTTGMVRRDFGQQVATSFIVARYLVFLSSPLIYAWTDSAVALSWLQGDPSQFKPCVRNRVAEIMDGLPSNRWHHISGSSNPADCALRGLYPVELANYDMWWESLSWLRLSAQD